MTKTLESEICYKIMNLFNAQGILEYKYLIPNIIETSWDNTKIKLRDFMYEKLGLCFAKDYDWIQEQYDKINYEITGFKTTYGYLYSADTILGLANEYNEECFERYYYNNIHKDILEILDEYKNNNNGDKLVNNIKKYFIDKLEEIKEN